MPDIDNERTVTPSRQHDLAVDKSTRNKRRHRPKHAQERRNINCLHLLPALPISLRIRQMDHPAPVRQFHPTECRLVTDDRYYSKGLRLD